MLHGYCRQDNAVRSALLSNSFATCIWVMKLLTVCVERYSATTAICFVWWITLNVTNSVCDCRIAKAVCDRPFVNRAPRMTRGFTRLCVCTVHYWARQWEGSRLSLRRMWSQSCWPRQGSRRLQDGAGTAVPVSPSICGGGRTSELWRVVVVDWSEDQHRHVDRRFSVTAVQPGHDSWTTQVRDQEKTWRVGR